MTETTLGRRIAERRRMLTMSQEAFGEKMGVSRQAISKWEADAATPEVDKLITMSKLFGVSVGWLLGVETTEPTKEAAASDDQTELAAQILKAFQPPQPEPEPEPSSAGEPAPPAPEPEPEPLPSFKWLPLVCAVVAVLSLILSIFSLTRSGQQPAGNTDPTSDSSTEGRIAELEDQIVELQGHIERIEGLIQEDGYDIIQIQNELEAALTRIDVLMSEADSKPSEEPDLPSYDSLSDWSLTCTANGDLTKVTLTLSAAAKVETASARFVAQLDGVEVAGADCTLDGRGYFTRLDIPPSDGYQYLLILTHKDGTAERITLEGHGLSDLSKLTSPRVSTTKWKDSFTSETYTTDRFYMGWQNVFLNIPELASEDAEYEWSDLRVSYYHNEGLVSEEILAEKSNVLDDADLTKRVQSFQVPTFTYVMPAFRDGDTHELRLEGTLSINGQKSEFSVPLIAWVIKGTNMVEVEN